MSAAAAGARPTPWGLLALAAAGVVVAFLALYPVVWLAYGSLRSAPPLQPGELTLGNYARAYADPGVWRAMGNTLVFAVGQAALGVMLGTILGWIIVRTNTPGRRAFALMLLVLFLIPLILAVTAWTILLNRRYGVITVAFMWLFGLEEPPFNVYSMGGMIFVQGLYITPLAFLMIAPALSNVDASLEEAARVAGAGVAATFFKVTLRLAAPAIFSAGLLLFIVGLESFDVPQLLGAPRGIFTFTALIFDQILSRYPPDYGAGTSLAIALLVLSAAAVFVYQRLVARSSRFETIRGRGHRASTIDLGGWRWLAFAFCAAFFLLTVVLPVLVLLVGSFLRFFGRFDLSVFSRMSWVNYEALLQHPALLRGFVNSIVLALGSAVACVLLAAAIAFIVARSRLPGRAALEAVAMMPIAFPATVLAIGLLWGYIRFPVPVYGTLAILAIAYVTRYLPVALRTVSSGLIQIGAELEESARTSGATWFVTFRLIILPLLRPSMAAAGLILFMIFFRELAMSIVLSGTGNPVLSVVMYDYYQSGELGALSAMAVLMLAFILVVVAAARRIGALPAMG